ncbi:MAG: hypothetical protein AAF939_17325 [Planctomycetota bacterium]
MIQNPEKPKSKNPAQEEPAQEPQFRSLAEFEKWIELDLMFIELCYENFATTHSMKNYLGR